jgi:hypothetical protein
VTTRWPVDQGDHQFDLTRQMFFWVETAELDDSVIIVVGGAIDVPTADRFADALQFALSRGRRVIVVDISQVECLTGSWQMFRELSSALEQGSDAPGEVVCFG